MIKNLPAKEVNLDTDPNDMYILPNGTLAIVNSSQKNITLHDRNLLLIKTVEKINNKKFHPLRITSNDKNRIYITDLTSCQVIMTDFDFNKINAVGDKGSGEYEFNYPNGIAYFEKKLYVCDSDNKRLQVLTDNLEFERQIALDYEPWIIKISTERVVCISQFDQAGLNFYDFDTFVIKYTYKGHGYGKISEICSYFIEACKKESKIYFYDYKGCLTNEMFVGENMTGCLSNTADGSMVYFNHKLIFSTSSKKKLVYFDRHD
jgi:hypothetical protein